MKFKNLIFTLFGLCFLIVFAKIDSVFAENLKLEKEKVTPANLEEIKILLLGMQTQLNKLDGQVYCIEKNLQIIATRMGIEAELESGPARYVGNILWFDAARGIGYINSKYSADVFFYTDQVRIDQRDKINPGEYVNFDLESNAEQGLIAIQISLAAQEEKDFLIKLEAKKEDKKKAKSVLEKKPSMAKAVPFYYGTIIWIDTEKNVVFIDNDEGPDVTADPKLIKTEASGESIKVSQRIKFKILESSVGMVAVDAYIINQEDTKVRSLKK